MASGSDLVVISSAGGRQASHLIPILEKDTQFRLRLVVQSSASKERLSSRHPNAEVVQADITEPSEARRVLKGAQAVYHVGPSLNSHEKEMGINMIDAALAESTAGSFKHFVYSSVICTQLRKLHNHDCKRYVEEHLIESGLPFTVLQPTNFMLYPVAQMMEQEAPVFTSLWSTKIPSSQVSLEDYAEASAKVLAGGERHLYAQYQCVATPKPVSHADVVQAISKAIGKEVRINELPYEEGVRTRLKMGLGPDIPKYTRDGAQRLVLYYNNYSVVGNPNVLEFLLGKKPLSVEEWVTLQVQKARPG